MDIRRSLLPRDEFLHAMDGFMSTLERPVMAIHLRVSQRGPGEHLRETVNRYSIPGFRGVGDEHA